MSSLHLNPTKINIEIYKTGGVYKPTVQTTPASRTSFVWNTPTSCRGHIYSNY